MATETSVKLRVSVWKDYPHPRALVHPVTEGVGRHIPAGETYLQQEIFCWSLKDDLFGGIADSASRQDLHELLEQFQSGKPPEDRRIARLAGLIGRASTIIDGTHAEWITTQADPAEEEDVPQRINPLLAFKLHLQWLYECFEHHPGISVLIR